MLQQQQKKTITIDVSDNNKKIIIKFDYDYKLVNLIKSFSPPPSWVATEKCWEMSMGNLTKFIRVVSFFKTDYTVISLTEKARKYYEKLKERIKERNVLVEKINAIKALQDCELEDISEFVRTKLFNYQKVTHKFITETNGKCILSLDMGCGKTAVSLSYSYKKNFKTLVICPASLKLNWRDEVEKHLINASSSVIHSGDEIIVKTTKNKKDIPDFTIINYDLLIKRKNISAKSKSLITYNSLIKALEKETFDCIILDEAHKMQNDSAGWTKFIHKYCNKIKYKLLLSGTPIKSRPIQYYSLLKFLDKDYWNSKVEFSYRWCNPTFNGFGMSFNGASNLEELYYETSPYIIRKNKEDVLLDLPDKLYEKVAVELSPNEIKAYAKLEEKTIEELNQYSDEEINRNVGSLQLIHQLRQFTGDIKIEASIEFIENFLQSTDRKMVVFSQYIHPLKELHRKFGEELSVLYTGEVKTDERYRLEQKFKKSDSCRIFFGSIGAAGVGLNLTEADVVLFIEQAWTPADVEQCVGRCHRIGSKNTVNIYTLVCENTVDEYIYKLLIEKATIFSKVIENKDYESQATKSIINDIIQMYRNKK